MPEEKLIAQLGEAYEHLYDLVHLRTHPLLDVLCIAPDLSDKKRATRLHVTLLAAIDELDPGAQAPPLSDVWRCHRLMVLRYVKGLAPQGVADQLALSRRHYYRVRRQALARIATLVRRPSSEGQPGTQENESEVPEVTPLDHIQLLRLEAARMAQGDRLSSIATVLEGVLSVLDKMLWQRELRVLPLLPSSLPGTCVNSNILRQLLLGLLGLLVQHSRQATICLEADVTPSAVLLSLSVSPASALAPPAQERIALALPGLVEMATLSNVHIMPITSGPTITGFALQLPIAERCVLIVDDNEDILQLFRRFLVPHNYRVVTEKHTTIVLEQARALQPYAITLDLMMPGQDGWALLQALLNGPGTKDIPIIVCSVLRQRDLALSLGATIFLEKPVSEKTLLDALESLDQG
jgi:CheY-like chemotaxis protein